jgi:peptidoglycan/xylan/chitin deacetylase (PgdA/CDA1 family)
MREMKYCCFRFDVDTHACVTRGMPPLLDLAASLGVKFTFFVNMGRAFDRAITLRKAARRMLRRDNARQISAAAKLGLFDSAVAAALNPKAGAIAPDILRAAQKAGHEIGLHGGRNHARWEHYAQSWTADRVRDEVASSLRAMKESGITCITSFASPAWNSPACLQQVLPFLGFDTIADTYDATEENITQMGTLSAIPTNITPGPGRAGYFETMRMNGIERGAVVAHFKEQLSTKRSLAVVYDHPFFAGIHAIDLLRDTIKAAGECGFKVCTIKEAADALESRSPGLEAALS